MRLFEKAFKDLTGHDPFPWQSQLCNRLIAGDPPTRCNLPTGLGKTSIIPIWLIALAEAPNNVPRRLVYVVNRRTVVDQATREAENLRDNLGKIPKLAAELKKLCAVEAAPPLAISTLRGQSADNGEWMADPSRPAVIVGTVDMIGSRLLFSGYRTGSWQLSRHTGLIGQDALLVHDEAHLEPVFQKLIDWVKERQRKDGSPRPLRVLAMSATGRDNGHQGVFTLGRDDLAHPVVKQRYSEVRKAMHSLSEVKKLAENLVDLAWKHANEKARVIVYVHKPEDARNVRDGLIKRLSEASKDGLGGSRVALLTGTIRGYERERLLEHPAVQGLLNSHDAQGQRIAPAQTTWLVATSAGEVGADFDADHLVCDLAPLDSMIQRFGRVNRRGGDGRNARIDVVLNLPEEKAGAKGKKRDLTPFGQSCLATAAAMKKLSDAPGDDGEGAADPGPLKDVSPAALKAFVERNADDYRKAASPEPASVVPHDVVLDAWALTSVRDDWPLAHEVHPYLHGLDDPEPDTYVAWRAEVDELSSNDDATPNPADEIMRTVLKYYPLRPLELLREKPWRVAELLAALRQRCPQTSVVRVRQRSVTVQRLDGLSEDKNRLERELRYETVILPPSSGGLDDAGTMQMDGIAPVRDVADFAPSTDGRPCEVVRRRVLLTRDEEGQWRWRALEGAGSASDIPPGSLSAEPCVRWTDARDQAAHSLGMKYITSVVLEEDDVCLRRLLFFRKVERSQAKTDEPRVTISDHSQEVQRLACSITKALNLDTPLQQAFELAAGGHDLGKADPRWQEAIGNDDPGKPLAKSFGRGFNAWRLKGYRHEFGSLVCLIGQLPEGEVRDLALHLVASHHGRGRPHFEPAAMTGPEDLPPLLQPAEVARRFSRLQRRFGHWGLAWLESILMAADAAASAARGTAPAEDEEDEE